MNCEGLISAGINANCKLHPVGYERRMCIINKDDIDEITYATGKTNVISAITLKSNKTGYLILQNGKSFNGTKKSLVVNDYVNTFTKSLQFVDSEVGADAAEKLHDALANGEFIAIIENKDKGGSDMAAAFEVYGTETGLRAASMEEDAQLQGNRWTTVLEEQSCQSSAVYFFSTSYAATKTAFEALLPSA